MQQKVVGTGASVYQEGAQLDAGILLHGVNHVIGLVGNGLQSRSYKLLLFAPSGKPDHHAAGVRIPPGSPEAGEGRHEINFI